MRSRCGRARRRCRSTPTASRSIRTPCTGPGGGSNGRRSSCSRPLLSAALAALGSRPRPARPGGAARPRDERFYFFNLEFWPQDIYFLTGLLIMGAIALFLVTSLFGRVWCGYTCPQTVWTDLFMWVERLIEGDRNERMKRDARPMSADKAVWRKAAKHAVWLGIAFWTGGAWIMYYVDAPTVTLEVLDRHGLDGSLFLHRPVHRDDLPAGRLGARAGLHLHVPVAALPGGDAGRAERHRHLSGVARRAARQAQAGDSWLRPATASIAALASPPARPASTSATAASSNASTAASASTPATR